MSSSASFLQPASLTEIFYKHSGYLSDKWEQYLPVYELTLQPIVNRGEPISLLEVGVQNGGSLQIWSEFLPKGSSIVGVDVDPACAKLSMPDNVEIKIADGSSEIELQRIFGDAQFDVIVDDGSHRSDHIVSTFISCFKRLKPAGVYVIEDLHCSYYASHAGGYKDGKAAIEFLKNIIDAIHVDHFEDEAFKSLDEQAIEELRGFGAQIASVSFYDSIALVHKLAVSKDQPFRRVVTGAVAPVSNLADHLSLLPVQQLRTLLLTPTAVPQFQPKILEELGSSRAAAEVAKESLGTAVRELSHAQNETASVRRELTAAQEERDILQCERASLESQLTAERSRAASAEAALARVLSTKLWRTRALLGRVARGWPGYVERGLRLSVKATKLALSGELPQRLRARREFRRRLSALSYTPQPQNQQVADLLSPTDQYSAFFESSRADAQTINLQRRMAHSFGNRPLFSILVPAYRTPTDVFTAMVKSVVAQSYDNWELCIVVVDEGAVTAELLATARQLAADDERIRFKSIARNDGISINTNCALDMATGDWVVLLDHDDLLSLDALFELAKAINANADASFIYSDKDSIDRDGVRHFNPLFKPAWSPEIMLNANYLTHICTMRTETLRRIGGWDAKTDGAQDWDIFLRVIAEGGTVVHVPRVLYHWRLIETSVAAGGFEAKPYAAAAQLHALTKYLHGAGWLRAVPRFQGNYIRIGWGLTSAVNVSVVLLGCDTTPPWAAAGAGGAEILLVGKKEFPRSVDAVVNAARGEFVVLIDANFTPAEANWIDELVGPLANSAIAIVAGLVVDPADRVIDYGILFEGGNAVPAYRGESANYYGISGGVRWYRNFSAAPGGLLSFRKTAFLDIGGFASCDPSDRPDLVFTRKLVAGGGGRLLMNPFAEFRSAEQTSIWEDQTKQAIVSDMLRAMAPEQDPFLNPHLTVKNGGAPTIFQPRATAVVPVGHDFNAEARWVTSSYDIVYRDIEVSRTFCEQAPSGDLKSIAWIIPNFDVAFYGGINTILRVANHMQEVYGISSAFYVLGADSPKRISAQIHSAFPKLADRAKVTVLATPDAKVSVGSCDAAICTLWTTAFPLLKLTGAKKKFYFLQDWEPLFYPAGSISATVEATYRFGFHAICNTPSLAESYRTFGGSADAFLPAVDTSVFHDRGRSRRSPGDPFVLVCYGRPGTPRNCFESLAGAMRALKEKYGQAIDIVTAGAAWDPADYGLGGVLRNLGLLPYAETGRLYRSVDAGLVAMATRHPSYLPFEWMACGVAVVTNRNPYTEWMLQHEDNCLLSEITQSDLFDNVCRLVDDVVLRDRIAEAGVEYVQEKHSSWDKTCNHIHEIIKDVVAAKHA